MGKDGAERDLGCGRGARREHPRSGLWPTSNEVPGPKDRPQRLGHLWGRFQAV